MGISTSAPLLSAVDAYIAAPTGDNRDRLILAADEYRERWIVVRASARGPSQRKMKADRRNPPTMYDRKLGVVRAVDGIPVTLALQERTSKREGQTQTWWTLSWRTKYSPDGSNRRFYFTQEGYWTIPATVALEMMDEMDARGGFDEEYFDHRRGQKFNTRVSTEMTPGERAEALTKVTGPDEDWGADPLLVIISYVREGWKGKKVLIVDPETGTATFRSITENPDNPQKKVLRPGEGWWLDNSMMDANVQQMRTFHSHLRDRLAR